MRKKIILTLLIILLPILTFIAGCYVTTISYSFIIDPYTKSAGDAVTTYAALAILQNGDTERAMFRLEENLNSSLVTLSTLDQMKDGKSKERIKMTLGKIRLYREQHPYSSENESINELVNKALSYGIENQNNPNQRVDLTR